MNVSELKRIAVLQELDNDMLTRLAAVLEEKRYADSQTVFAEGDPGDSMYFIVDGCIRVEKRAQSDSAAQKTLAVLEPGDYFGEMALVDQKPRSAAAVAAGGASILRLTKAAFDEIQARNSAAGTSVLFGMIRTSSERIRRLSAHLVVYDEVGKAIGESSELPTLLDVILQQLASATEADWGLVLLRSEFSERLEVRCGYKLTLNAAQREAISQGRGFLAPVLQKRRHELVANFDEHEPFRSCQRLGFETASLLIAPINLQEHFLGLIVLGGQQRAQFDLNGLNLARGVARQTAQAITSARYREEEQARLRHAKQFVRF
jgi:CRP-like cAMP-binding protein